MNSGLVVVQVALSVALLVSAGLLARTLQALLAQDPGYDPKGVVTAQATLPGAGESPQRDAMRRGRITDGISVSAWRHVRVMGPQLLRRRRFPSWWFPGQEDPSDRSGAYLGFCFAGLFQNQADSGAGRPGF